MSDKHAIMSLFIELDRLAKRVEALESTIRSQSNNPPIHNNRVRSERSGKGPRALQKDS